jgi:proline iminopeptidase
MIDPGVDAVKSLRVFVVIPFRIPALLLYSDAFELVLRRIDSTRRRSMNRCVSPRLGSGLVAAIVAGATLGGAVLTARADDVYPVSQGFVDAHGVFIYYESMGRGTPLVVVHGGPGASHDYFLPYLLPLARHHRVVYIDERGSGKSGKLEDPKGYTVENMVDDVEAVRVALGLGKIDLLGHSYGGVLAQAYALRYQQHLSHLVLCSTFYSTREMNQVFVRMKEKMPPDLRARIDKMEANGLFGHGKDFEKGRYTNEYMTAAWGEAYFPYLYRNHPDAGFDPVAGTPAWDLYREMWGSHGEFVIDGNLASVEYGDKLGTIHTPTLITVGDHDECDPAQSTEMQAKIQGSKLVILPQSGHMTFVDQPKLWLDAVDGFLSTPASRP